MNDKIKYAIIWKYDKNFPFTQINKEKINYISEKMIKFDNTSKENKEKLKEFKLSEPNFVTRNLHSYNSWKKSQGYFWKIFDNEKTADEFYTKIKNKIKEFEEIHKSLMKKVDANLWEYSGQIPHFLSGQFKL